MARDTPPVDPQDADAPLVEKLSHRLLAIRWQALHTPAVVDAHRLQVRSFAAEARGKIVVLSDCRLLTVLDEAASTAMGTLLQGDNPVIERSAILLGSATVHLQFARLIREAGNAKRQAFRDTHAVLTWLGEVLQPAEISHARAFLAAPPRAVPAGRH